MLTLAIDTSSPTSGVAVVSDQVILGTVSTTVVETYSSRFFRQLEFLLLELEVKLADFELFAVVSGPGSFTGLRVGLASAKALGEAHGKRVVGVSALEALAWEGVGRGRCVAAVLNARRGEVFGAVYGEEWGEGEREGQRRGTGEWDMREVMGQSVMEAGKFVREARERAGSVPLMFITPSPELIAAEITGLKNTMMLATPAMLAPAAGKLGERRALRGLATSALELDANYVRRSDAELLWKAP
jgi:tRNA threonylcarbamoyladenosine biosynthesis protein TsaB